MSSCGGQGKIFEMVKFGLTWGLIHGEVTLIHGVLDVVGEAFLPDEAAHVLHFVQTVKEKAGADRAILLLPPLHEGDVALRVFAAGTHAVPVPAQFGRRQERGPVLHRLIGVEDKIIPTLLKLPKASISSFLTRGRVEQQRRDQKAKRCRMSFQERFHYYNKGLRN